MPQPEWRPEDFRVGPVGGSQGSEVEVRFRGPGGSSWIRFQIGPDDYDELVITGLPLDGSAPWRVPGLGLRIRGSGRISRLRVVPDPRPDAPTPGPDDPS